MSDTSTPKYVRRIVYLAMPAPFADRAAAQAMMRDAAPDDALAGAVERVPAVAYVPRDRQDVLCVTMGAWYDDAVGYRDEPEAWGVTHVESGLRVTPPTLCTFDNVHAALRMLDALMAPDLADGWARPWRDLMTDAQFRARAIAEIRATMHEMGEVAA